MTMKFDHLLTSYHEQIKGLTILEKKGDTDSFHLDRVRANAEQTLASFYLANKDDRYIDQLRKCLRFRLQRWKLKNEIGAWDFILYSCIALAVDDLDSFEEISQIDVNTKGYVPVTRELYKLHRAIFSRKGYIAGKAKKNKGEKIWFDALTLIAEGTEPDWSDFDTYWRLTRNRLHELTILQHGNLLKDGMQALWKHRYQHD